MKYWLYLMKFPSIDEKTTKTKPNYKITTTESPLFFQSMLSLSVYFLLHLFPLLSAQQPCREELNGLFERER